MHHSRIDLRRVIQNPKQGFMRSVKHPPFKIDSTRTRRSHGPFALQKWLLLLLQMISSSEEKRGIPNEDNVLKDPNVGLSKNQRPKINLKYLSSYYKLYKDTHTNNTQFAETATYVCVVFCGPIPCFAWLRYHDICSPRWLYSDPELFWGFWGQCPMAHLALGIRVQRGFTQA